MSITALMMAALVAGFFGSAHCIGMCGAIVVLFEGQQAGSGSRAAWAHRGLYNLGRLGFYVLLGAAGGAGGALLTTAAGVSAGLLLLRVLAGLLVIAIGLNLLVEWRFTDWLERAGALLWRRLAPLARHLLPITTPSRAFGAGLLWGALPCGLVYSAVALAAASGSATYGALVMLVFWLGTVPALLAAGVSAQRITQWKARRSFRRAAGLVMVLIGLLALMPVGKRLLGKEHGGNHAAHAGAAAIFTAPARARLSAPPSVSIGESHHW